MPMINLHKDGNRWCALLGPDLQAGVSGWGCSPKDALDELLHVIEIAGLKLREV